MCQSCRSQWKSYSVCPTRSSGCEGADSHSCKTRWSSASSCWTDHPEVWAAGLQAGWPENVAGTEVWNKCVCVMCMFSGEVLTVAASVAKVSEDLLSQHYCQLRTKPFYPRLLHYMTSGPVVVMVSAPLSASLWDAPLFLLLSFIISAFAFGWTCYKSQWVLNIFFFFILCFTFVQVWEGHKVIQASRTMVGHTNPAEAQAGTVRGDFSVHVSR